MEDKAKPKQTFGKDMIRATVAVFFLMLGLTLLGGFIIIWSGDDVGGGYIVIALTLIGSVILGLLHARKIEKTKNQED